MVYGLYMTDTSLRGFPEVEGGVYTVEAENLPLPELLKSLADFQGSAVHLNFLSLLA